ncbi:Tn3 family transposase [Streptomyces virginiae]|uniref:Tn3 family transposase n=1 Tax=Streptomyces virginiae TaxID=1961 RepID=UPI00364F2316
MLSTRTAVAEQASTTKIAKTWVKTFGAEDDGLTRLDPGLEASLRCNPIFGGEAVESAEVQQERSVGYPSFVDGIPERDWGRLRLDEKDLKLVGTKRGEHSRLGFGVLVTVVRFLGRFETDMDRVPEELVLRVAEQLGMTEDPLAAIRRYGQNRDQVQAHAREIAEQHGWTPYSAGKAGLVAQLEAHLKVTTDGPTALTVFAVERLRKKQVLLPSYTTLRSLVVGIRDRVDEKLSKTLCGRLTGAQISVIDGLMKVPAGKGISGLEQLRRGVGEPSWAAFERALSRVDAIMALGFIDVDVSDIPDRKLAHLAAHAMTERVSRLANQSGKRAAVLAAIKGMEKHALDDAMDMLDKLITQQFLSRPKGLADKDIIAAYPTFAPAGALVAQVMLAVLNAVKEQVDPETGEITDPEINTYSMRALIEGFADRYIVEAAAEILAEHTPSPGSDTHEGRRAKMLERYPALRSLVPVLVDRVPFGATPAGQPALTALWSLPDLLDREDLRLGDIDTTLLTGSWKGLVQSDPDPTSDTVNMKAYAFCVLETFHHQLCQREIFAVGASRWGDLRAALLSGEAWEEASPALLTSLGLPGSPEPYLADARRILHAELTDVASRVPEGYQVQLDDGTLALRKTPGVPASLARLSRQVNKMLPRVELSQVVVEVLSRTGGARAFTTPNGSPSPYTEFDLSLAAVMVGLGSNLGLQAVAEEEREGARETLTLARLDHVSRTYFRPDTIEAFNTLMLEKQAESPVTSLWNEGRRLAIVDGLRFVIPPGSTNLRIAPRGETEVTWMTVITERAIQLSGRLVSGSPSAALEALDTLTARRLGRADVPETSPDPAADAIVAKPGTHEDLVFGLLALSGYSYQPTPKQLASIKLWRIDGSADYGALQDATRRRIDLARITEHWDEILRVIGSIRHGVVSAHTALRILTRNGRPTQLGMAITDVGRIAKTRHLLRLFDNPDFRRQIEAQSALHEARQRLAKRICHAVDGPYPEYLPGLEEQLGALGLVLNAVALFNTIYIQMIVDKLRARGHTVLDTDIAQLSTLLFAHINMHGRFHFELDTGATRTIPDPEPDTSPATEHAPTDRPDPNHG